MMTDLVVALIAIAAAVLGGAGLRWSGRRAGKAKARTDAEKARADTLKRMHDADSGDGDSDADREWLRDRGER